MGMSATQLNFLSLTNRKNNIEYDMLRLTTDKTALTREMDKVQKEYRNSLNAKKYKYTVDSGANYKDLTYATLMYPSGYITEDKLNMITDMNGRVVLDSRYAEAAKLISPDGSPGNWEAHQWEVLEQLTGIDKDSIETAMKNYRIFTDGQIELATLKAEEPDKSRFTKVSTSGLMKKLGDDWFEKYKTNEDIDRNDIPSIMDTFKAELTQYFLDDESMELFRQACDTVKTTTAEPSNMKGLVDYLLGVYKGLGGLVGNDQQGNTQFLWYDVDSTQYEKYLEKHDAWQEEVDTLEADMEAALEQYNSTLDSEARTKLNFYTNLFQAVAERGWSYSSEVSDPEYLNQMLMNNMYYITEVKTELMDSDTDTYLYKNIYDTQPAANCIYLVKVNDTDNNEAALMKYEHEKRRIQARENKDDTLLKNHETELAAINQMLQSYQKIINDEVGKYYKIFNG